MSKSRSDPVTSTGRRTARDLVTSRRRRFRSAARCAALMSTASLAQTTELAKASKFELGTGFMPEHEQFGCPTGGSGWGILMAGAVLVIVPILLVFAALQRYIVAGLTQGSVTG